MLKYVEKITEFTESENYTGIFLKQLCEKTMVNGSMEHHLLKSQSYFHPGSNVHIRQKLNDNSYDWKQGDECYLQGYKDCR